MNISSVVGKVPICTFGKSRTIFSDKLKERLLGAGK
jgi:hypothetical protein